MARRILSTFVLAALPALAAAEPPSPEAALGFRVGEDRKLADWTQIVEYFRALDAASPRVLVEDVGKTTEGRPFLVATVTSEANMARLEEIRRANLRLADPRGLSEEEAGRLVAEGRAVVALNYGIHSTEVAAPQTAMEEAWRLATTSDPDLLSVLDRTVILMIPSHNPDGTQKVTEWYRKSLGTPWEGGTIPFLYHHYAGHDNNRDWYMFTQVETQLTVRHVYDRWRPQVVHDLHQMGAREARIFVPPYVDPWEPNVDPALDRRRQRRGLLRGGAAHHGGQEGRGHPRDVRRLEPRPRLPAHARRRPRALRVRIGAHGHADRGEVRRAGGRHRLRRQARVVELPRAVAGGNLAAARHRGLPARGHARAARPRGAQPRVLAAHVPGGQPPRGRTPGALRLRGARGAEGPAGHRAAPPGDADGRGRGAPRARAVRGGRPALRRGART